MMMHTYLHRATVSVALLLLILAVLFGCTDTPGLPPDTDASATEALAATEPDSEDGSHADSDSAPSETVSDGSAASDESPEATDSTEPSDSAVSTDSTDSTEPSDSSAPESESTDTTSEAETTGGEPDTVVVHEAVGSPTDYRPAASRAEALERAERGEIAGYLYVPDQAPLLSPVRPMSGEYYIRNSAPYFADEDTYVVVDYAGREVFRVYRGGGYITLEEVAAYVYAFGEVPPNYNSGKKLSPTSSPWGEYLRLNHSKFTGNTSKYPYEPELPDISGCGGELIYYELDIGTQGTDCDPRYTARIYNDGSRITRGAARIVYARYDRNGDQIIDPTERYLFYTYNHYNDFREYLGYYGGWGEMFGNITGGGKISSKTDYNPTPYVPVVMAELAVDAQTGLVTDILWYDFRRRDALWAA